MRPLTTKLVEDDFLYVSDAKTEGSFLHEYLDSSARKYESGPTRIATVSKADKSPVSNSKSPYNEYLEFVSSYIDSISDLLRPVSLKIHDNPELNYEEYIAHETLTRFLETRKGWKVTPSAYGLPTAFIAVYDSGKEGPVISYNAEYGK